MGRADQTTIIPKTQSSQIPPPTVSGAGQTTKEDEHQSLVGSPSIRAEQRERVESLSSPPPSILNEAFPDYRSDSPDSPQLGITTLEVTPTTTGSQRLPALPPVVKTLQARDLVGSSSPGQDDDTPSYSPAPILDDEVDDRFRAGEFVSLWAWMFDECQSAVNFNTIMTNCTADWLLKSSNTSEEENVPQTARASRATSVPTARTQSRQQQRVRHRRKFDANEVSRIQELFKIYHKKAVRRVLGESSPPYTGTLEAADEYLRATYHRPQLERSKKLFNNCSWSAPSADQLGFLDHPPTRIEIAQILRRAVNTSLGKDQIEYRPLWKLDPEGLLLKYLWSGLEIWDSGGLEDVANSPLS